MVTVDPKRLFAANLRRLRQSTGFSQEALADRAEPHRTYISSVERGERNVSLENIFRIAKALGADPRELLAPEKKAGGK
ncbi:MAG: helix-turn-helix domain-containing protein [Bradyrhizobium sp.]